MFLNSSLGRKKRTQNLGVSLRKVSIPEAKRNEQNSGFFPGDVVTRQQPSINNSRWIYLYPKAFSVAFCSFPINILACLLDLNAALLKNYYQGRIWYGFRKVKRKVSDRSERGATSTELGDNPSHIFLYHKIYLFLILIILLFDSALVDKLIFSLWIFSALFLRWKSRICAENLGKKVKKPFVPWYVISSPCWWLRPAHRWLPNMGILALCINIA